MYVCICSLVNSEQYMYNVHIFFVLFILFLTVLWRVPETLKVYSIPHSMYTVIDKVPTSQLYQITINSGQQIYGHALSKPHSAFWTITHRQELVFCVAFKSVCSVKLTSQSKDKIHTCIHVYKRVICICILYNMSTKKTIECSRMLELETEWQYVTKHTRTEVYKNDVSCSFDHST